MTTSSIKKNGIFNGGIIGLTYILILYIVSSVTGNGFMLNIYSIIMMLIGVVAGMIGGIVRSKFEMSRTRNTFRLTNNKKTQNKTFLFKNSIVLKVLL